MGSFRLGQALLNTSVCCRWAADGPRTSGLQAEGLYWDWTACGGPPLLSLDGWTLAVVLPPGVSQLTAGLSFTVNLEGMVPTPGAQPRKWRSSPSVTRGGSG